MAEEGSDDGGETVMAHKEHAVDRAARVLAIIRSAADAGEKCPTNLEIADRVGYASISGPANAINLLEASGVITVQRGQASRVVTIVATGRSTAGRVRWAHHKFRDPTVAPPSSANDERNRLAEFTEAIAEGASLQEAAKIASMTKREAAWSWSYVRRQLGHQAR